MSLAILIMKHHYQMIK